MHNFRGVAEIGLDADLVPCLLLCSDGLWDEISFDDVAAVLSGSGPAKVLANSLVEKALSAGGHDNITAVVYRHYQ